MNAVRVHDAVPSIAEVASVIDQRAPSWAATIDDAVEKACSRIAPNWPLDQSIAVNPLWGWIDHSFSRAWSQVSALAGTRAHMDREYYWQKFKCGDITRAHVALALDELRDSRSVEKLVAAIAVSPPTANLQYSTLLADALDARADLRKPFTWRDIIAAQIGQCCASYFDTVQADWHGMPTQTLYAHWRDVMMHEHGLIAVTGKHHLVSRAAQLPLTSNAAIRFVVERLEVTSGQLPDWLTALLMRVNGWASWCAYLRWSDRLQGQVQDHSLVDLLATMVCWEWLIDDGQRDAKSAWSAWRHRVAVAPQDGEGEVWLRAHEIAYQTRLLQALRFNTPSAQKDPVRARVDAVFCIDVRSEPFRRAFELSAPHIRTHGFAGFFGLPIAYAPLGAEAQRRSHLPGLLAPAMTVTDSAGAADKDAALRSHREQRLARFGVYRSFERLPSAAFTRVEALGIGYLNKLLRRTFGLQHEHDIEVGWRKDEAATLNPTLPNDLSIAERTTLAERILRAMSLPTPLAPIVLLIGHGAQTANNPQAAALHCGACGGQTGEVNARALAALLNDVKVQAGVRARGFDLPSDTKFIAGLHNTTTDEVRLFVDAHFQEAHEDEWRCLVEALSKAGDSVRQSRAVKLGLSHVSEKPEVLLRSLRQRANDWAQTRPEWGLANNAAFIVGPREWTRTLDLEGRAFLHNYDWQHDQDGSILELIMTAPMIVTHWINLQYYASTVEPQRFGSGNKTLHNVVGAHIGVFEGNGGDLRIGLAMQSVHDGKNWMHEPLRLTVAIAAPKAMIESIIARHAMVAQLIANQWLYLFCADPKSGAIFRAHVSDDGVVGWREPVLA